MALLFAMVLGADSIDDCDVLRAGRTRRLLGGWVAGAVDAGDVPARVHVRARAPARRAARRRRSSGRGRPAPGPATGGWSIDVDSFVGEVCGRLKQGAAYGYTQLFGLPPDPRHPGGHARDAAHPPAQGVGEHAEGDAALLRGADRARRPRRRDRRQAAAGRLGVLEHEGLRAAWRRPAGSTRSACG